MKHPTIDIMDQMNLVKTLFVIGLIAFFVSYFQVEKLPDTQDILPELMQAPIQTAAKEPNLNIRAGDIDYIVNPQYNYELYGLVVSYNNSHNWWDYYHNKWKDYINIKDICIVWGDNLKNGIYQNIKFESGSFTCYYKWDSGEVGSQFSPNSISNNHLLSIDENINNEILKARKGDQIHLRGFLANYSHSNGTFRRNTSIIRSDTGNNACEVVYVTEFKIIKAANDNWREIFKVSKYLIAACFLLSVIQLFFFPVRTLKD